jgi:hypothetical protein
LILGDERLEWFSVLPKSEYSILKNIIEGNSSTLLFEIGWWHIPGDEVLYSAYL